MSLTQSTSKLLTIALCVLIFCQCGTRKKTTAKQSSPIEISARTIATEVPLEDAPIPFESAQNANSKTETFETLIPQKDTTVLKVNSVCQLAGPCFVPLRPQPPEQYVSNPDQQK